MTSEKMLPQVVGIILDEQAPLTLAELTRACAVHAELIVELVEEGVLILSMDITDRRNAEDSLRRAEARQRALLQGLPEHVFLLDADHNVIAFLRRARDGRCQPGAAGRQGHGLDSDGGRL